MNTNLEAEYTLAVGSTLSKRVYVNM